MPIITVLFPHLHISPYTKFSISSSSHHSMALNVLPFLLPILLISPAVADDPTAFVYAGCSQPKFPPNSPYQYNLDSLLSSVANSAAFSSYSNFSSPDSPFVSALYQCRGDLSLPACSSCIRAALTRLSPLCPSASAAALQLRACYIRYGNDTFVARPDTSLLYKTCSSGIDTGLPGSDFLQARDSAFSSLSGGSYRVGAAGGVMAEAQCVGDLDDGDCSDCVGSAAAQVKASCGGAASGEAYLGKCYVRYYADGARPYAYGGGGGDSGVGHDDDETTGKTLAIIIGLMAGVALIIVFLSFIKRSGSGKY